MAKSIQIEAEMQVPHGEMPLTSGSSDETDEGTSLSIKDPDTMLILIVLLLACLALALLANAII